MKESTASTANLPFSPVLIAVVSGCLLLLSLGLLLFRFTSRKKEAENAKQQTQKSAEAEEVQQTFQKVPVVVLYGTQTGTAEGFAKTVSKELRQSIGGKADVIMADIDEYGSNDEQYETKLKNTENPVIALLLLATYGDGEPTDNAARFCRLLAKLVEAADSGTEGTEHMGTMFSPLSFAVFGLGNRQYEHFNAVAKAVDKQLSSLGGTRLLELGLGDDDQCLEDDFEAWKTSAAELLQKEVEGKWQVLNKEALVAEAKEQDRHGNGDAKGDANGHMNGHMNGHEMATEAIEDDWNATEHGLDVVFFEDSSSEAQVAREKDDAFKGGENWHGHDVSLVPLTLIKELHSASSSRSCLHVELDLRQAGLHYTAGDHVAVLPQNEEADVAKAAALLGFMDKLSSVFSLQPHKQADGAVSSTAQALGSAFASPVSLDTALRCMVDLHSCPKKAALLLLASHASDPSEAEKLRHLASSTGKAEYLSWILQSHRSLLEVLEAFPSTRPPLPVFLTSLAPRLQPRFYSISSSNTLTPGTLSITCSVVDDVTPGGRVHHGVCSFFLKKHNGLLTSAKGAKVPVFIRPSTFRLPPSPSTPIIMIGPGTGLAPFRGFLQERQAIIERSGQGKGTVGAAVLFFGCRMRDQDYLYEDELAGFRDSGALSDLHVAFSREGKKKVYVQHLLKDQADLVWRLWSKEQGFLYVCGDAKHMARDVHSTLLEICQSKAGVSATEADALIRDMQQDGRYHRDVW